MLSGDHLIWTDFIAETIVLGSDGRQVACGRV